MADTDHRWTTVTPDDHSGLLYIVAFLACTYSTLTFFTRCFIKWRVAGLDDAAMAVAQILSYIQFSLLLVSLSAGLGKSFGLLSPDDYDQMVAFQFGNQIAVYLTLGFSKIATILLTQRLFTRDMKKPWTICNIATCSMVVWTALAGFLASAGCSPESTAPREVSQRCPSIVARYGVIVATDAITDVMLVVVPAYLCWQLQMSVVVKFQVLAVFSFRLPLIGLAIAFIKTWTSSLSSANPGVDRTLPLVLQQCELCVSLVAGTIPCLKSFLRSFDTGSGVKAGFGSSNEYGSYGQSGGSGSHTTNHTGSYKMSSLRRKKATSPKKRSWTDNAHDNNGGDIQANTRPFASARANASHGVVSTDPRRAQQQDEYDRDSQGSRCELFIRKDLVWEVSSDARRNSDTPGMLKLPK